MSKRSRFLLILVVLGICFAFLWPSLKWYAYTPKEVQTLGCTDCSRTPLACSVPTLHQGLDDYQ